MQVMPATHRLDAGAAGSAKRIGVLTSVFIQSLASPHAPTTDKQYIILLLLLCMIC